MESHKEKAKELVEKYREQAAIGFNQGSIYPIECAKIAVNKVIEALRIANSMYELHELLNEYKGIKNELNNM